MKFSSQRVVSCLLFLWPWGGPHSTWCSVPSLPWVSKGGHRTPLEGELTGITAPECSARTPFQRNLEPKVTFQVWGAPGAPASVSNACKSKRSHRVVLGDWKLGPRGQMAFRTQPPHSSSAREGTEMCYPNAKPGLQSCVNTTPAHPQMAPLDASAVIIYLTYKSGFC